MANRHGDKRASRPSALLNHEDVRRERAIALKRSRAGHLSATTNARQEVEKLMQDHSDVVLIREKFNEYEAQWKNFVVSHNKFMDSATPDEQIECSKQFDALAQLRINFSSTVENFICNAATALNEHVMENLQEMSSHRRGSVKSRTSGTSRNSASVTSSKAHARRLEAEKAQLALFFAEQEKQRLVEAEIKMLELERKQREYATMRELQEEELKGIMRLESLKTEADAKLAEARKTAALMDLEVKIVDETGDGLSDMETSSVFGTNEVRNEPDVSTPAGYAPPVGGNLPALTCGVSTYTSTVPSTLALDSQQTTATVPVFSAIPRVSTETIVTSAHPPRISASTAATNSPGLPAVSSLSPWAAPFPAPSAQPSSCEPAITRVTFTPAHPSGIGASATAAANGLDLPTADNLSPLVPPFPTTSAQQTLNGPAFTKVTSTPVYPPGFGVPSTATINGFPFTQSYSPSSARPISHAQSKSSTHDEVLALVVSTMKDISMTQQTLAYNQSLPPIHFQRFSGMPEEFPLFKQRFKRIVMSREDLDEESKMTRLLQFLDGEAKEAVSGLETVAGGIHQALAILDQRYGRPCMIVGSVVANLVKGPPIASGDKSALRKFADQATRALATLTAMNCLAEINQGNIVSMAARLPKPLQEKFAALAYDLEAKGQRFPTLAIFVNFLTRHANIANHPISGKFQQFSYNNPIKNRKLLPSGRQEPPKFTTMSISNNSKTTPQPSRTPQKNGSASSNSCRCCGQAHPLYRCEEFKKKTPQERATLVSSKKMCPNCLKNTEHSTDTCTSSFRCRIQGCGAFHHSLLHPTQLHVSISEDHTTDGPTAAVDTTASVSSCTTTRTEESGTILLQVVPLRVVGPNGLTVTTYAMLDSGSEITLVDPSLVSFLGLSGQPDRLVFSTVSNHNEPHDGERVNLAVESLIDDHPQQLQLQRVWSGKELSIPLRHQCIATNKSRWPHLHDVPFPEVQRQKVSLIIGADVPEVFVPLEVRYGSANDPIAIRSCLGFAVLGRIGDRPTQQRYDVHHIHTGASDLTLNHQVELFWQSESLGTEPYKSLSVEDRRAEQIIDKTISKTKGHYSMGLLWQKERPSLPFNRPMAEIRLRHLKRRLERDKDLHIKYRSVIDDYVAKGHARKLTREEAHQITRPGTYLITQLLTQTSQARSALFLMQLQNFKAPP